MIKLSFLGDILCDEKMAKDIDLYRINGCLNYDSVFFPISETLKNSDYTLANLETPISYSNNDLTNKQYCFFSPFAFAEAVRHMGVNYVSTANNHCMDQGMDGIRSTIEALDKINLDHSGTYTKADDLHYVIKEIQGVRFAILSYTYGTNAFSNRNYLSKKELRLIDMIQEQEEWIDQVSLIKKISKAYPRSIISKADRWLTRKRYPDNVGKMVYEKETVSSLRKHWIRQTIKELKKEKVDFIIVYLHVGGQYNTEPSALTKKTVDFFKKIGCNIVIANHEHVVHGHTLDMKKPFFATYAIGNFLSSNGTVFKPHDRYCEYSILLHTYIDEFSKQIQKISFSISKVILNNEQKFEVWDSFDLLKKENSKQLSLEILQVAKIFSGIEYLRPEPEYFLYDSVPKN